MQLIGSWRLVFAIIVAVKTNGQLLDSGQSSGSVSEVTVSQLDSTSSFSEGNATEQGFRSFFSETSEGILAETTEIFIKPENTTREVQVLQEEVTVNPTVSLSFSSTSPPFIMPPNCSAYPLLSTQPHALKSSKIKKCCPLGQNYQYTSTGRRFCGNETLPFNVQPIHAKFFERCIEDEEKNMTSEVVVENNCHKGLVYSEKYLDLLYVLQNSSLLRVASDFTSYDIFEHYCLDMDSEDLVLTAIVCQFDDLLIKVNQAQAFVFAMCMMISVPCLIATATLYLLVPELNDLHGKSLAGHSFCLASGFGLLAFTQFRDHSAFEGYFIQYCILSCFFWLTVMWIDICLHAWYYLPRGLNPSESDDNYHLMYYGLIALGIPLVLVLLTYKFGLSGLPSYYIKGVTQVARSSQMFFIPPISFTLCLNLVLYASSYFGFRQLQEIRITEFLAMNIKRCAAECRQPKHNAKHIAKVETMFKSTSFLTLIMTINWIFEIISFYTGTSSTIFDVINALQGVLIFIIFLCLPRPKHLIVHWWKDQGSYATQGLPRGGRPDSFIQTEMTALRTNEIRP